ncbi:alpha/beta fold hydrolase [Sphingobacterium zeae]|uniref:Alpha-beta hydrolase superfamily lysophospholipase n=1 Tax=Sphingobacterium zeae TaxID=1776859 RepID=A0ABU0U4G6_9SPHI|nr:alpha/beta fold hydrolase [Sphingobacterium zeae]MDQ1149849.1 alpha-beta hydrolase superfamily lysophospholipase [Sphingobacterium zeae]
MNRVSSDFYVINTAENKYKISYNFYEPTDHPVLATILIIHGMQEHSGRYQELASYLTAQQFAVLTYDQLGHGLTASQPDLLGYFQKEKAKEQLIDDAITMSNFLRETYPQLPQFILGHSMGSFVTRCVLQKIGWQFKGAIIVGTGQRQKGSMAFRLLLTLLNSIAPKERSKLINRIFDKRNNARFKNEPNQNNSNWLSVRKTNRISFLEDPLCGGLFTNNGFHTVLDLSLQATAIEATKNIPKNLPIVFISGQDDTIGDFGIGVEKSAAQLRAQGQTDITLKLYAGMRHEILNEDCKMEVFQFISSWLHRHLL